MRNGAMLDLIPAEQMPLVEQQIDAMFGLPWYMTLLGAVERVFAICFHLAASLMVMQVFVRGQIRWLFAAIGWHTLLNAAAVIAVTQWGALATEGIVGALAIVSIIIILRLRDDGELDGADESEEEETAVFTPKPTPITPDKLDESRFS